MTNALNPWTTLSSRRLYENGWVAFDESLVRDPIGQLSSYATVHCKRRSVSIVPIDSEGFTYLVGQYRYAARRYTWEIPGGSGSFSEPALAAAKRELEEEVGFIASSWMELSSHLVSSAITDENFQTFIAWDLASKATSRDPTEILKVSRVSFDEALTMAATGRIEDAISVAALLLVGARARSGALPTEPRRLVCAETSAR